MKHKIKFEVGDIVFCPYYNIKGEITKFNNEYIHIKDGDEVCVTKILTKSANSHFPVYLQMICKKDDKIKGTCRECKKDVNTEDVRRKHGSCSVIYMLSFCSAECYIKNVTE